MKRHTASLVLCALLATTSPALAQRPATASTGVVVLGTGSFSPIVKDLDKSLAFYRTLLGVPAPADAAPVAFGADQTLLNFLGTPKAEVRVATVRIPGTTMNVEIVEFRNIDRKPVQARLQDPGATMLVLLVRDIDTLFARLKSEGVPVVTAGGKPLDMGDGSRSVVIKDPDGFHISLLQENPVPATTAPASSNVIGARDRKSTRLNS